MAITNIVLVTLNPATKLVRVTFSFPISPTPNPRILDFGPTVLYGGVGSPVTPGILAPPDVWKADFIADTLPDRSFHYEITMNAEVSGDQLGVVDPVTPGVFSNLVVKQLGSGNVELQYDNDAAAPVTTEAEFGPTPAFGTTVPTVLVSGTTYKTASITPVPPGDGFYWRGVVDP